MDKETRETTGPSSYNVLSLLRSGGLDGKFNKQDNHGALTGVEGLQGN
jgi:hypothetical protein